MSWSENLGAGGLEAGLDERMGIEMELETHSQELTVQSFCILCWGDLIIKQVSINHS